MRLILAVSFQGVLLVVLVMLSLLPAWHLTQWLQRRLQPRRSFGRFLLYILLCLALVFAYTFTVTLLLLKLFPPPRR